MKTAGAIPAFVRAGALLIAGLLFVIAIFTDLSGAWTELVGIGLALMAIVEALGFGRPGHSTSRTQAIVKLVAHGAAALFFLIGAFSESSLTEMFALGFLLFVLALAFDHLTDFSALKAGLEAAADRVDGPEAAAPLAAPAGPTVKCSNCSAELAATQKFCPACGTARSS